MKFVFELLFVQLQLAFQRRDQLGGVFAATPPTPSKLHRRLFLMTMIRLAMVTSQSVNA